MALTFTGLMGTEDTLPEQTSAATTASDTDSLERSEHRLKVATAAAGLGIWEWDLGTNLFTFTPKARQIFGFPQDGSPITYDQMQAVMHPDDLPEIIRLSERALDPTIRAHEPYRYRIRRADNAQMRWISAHGEALFDEAQRPVTYVGTFQDVTEQVVNHTLLAQSEARLRMAMEAGDLAVWELDIASDTVTVSPELNALFGFPPDARPTADDLRSRYAPGEAERLQRLGAEAMARGENRITAEVRHIWPDGTVKWLLLQAHAAPPLEGGGPRAIGVVLDITERKMFEERLQIVARELQHRVKNSLAVVQTLVRQSFRPDRSLEDGHAVFAGRLHALSGATDVMTTQGLINADVGDVVERITAPYRDGDADPFVVSGPPATISGKAAVSLGMALHELCTNAVKHGALSTSEGQVTVRRQMIWLRLRLRLAECLARPGVDVMRRACGAASVDVRWSVA